ncbi:MAG: glyceraldehyde-3-phosphate dehydrogenase [Bacteroidota bacterium]|nr:glyceraldehyde-3-phosphate dehydrogenase [Bacteroidota bacterium]
MRVAINGMGRIGRLLFRRLIENDRFELVAVNDTMPADNLAYLLKYDSVYGTFSQEILMKDNFFLINNKRVAVFKNENPSMLPWKELAIDVVLECTGSFSSLAGANEHITAGAKKVLLSTTGADDIPLLIYGFNHTRLKPDMNIISPGGCMTNCSIHVLYILNSISIKSAHINIIHSYTSRQELVDAPNKNFRRGRASAESIIPVEIELKKSLERLMPGMQNKIAATSTRVPVANGAMAIFTIQLNDEVSSEQANLLFKKAAKNDYIGIIDYTDDPIVSLDIKGNTHSCIIDGSQTSVIGNHLQVVAWFDNEYGFTSRMLDWLQLLKG